MRGLSWHHRSLLPPGDALTAGRADTRCLPGHLPVLLPTTVACSYPYSQNIRTRLSTGGYAPYHRRTSPCLPAPPSRILTGNRDGDDYRGEAMDWKHLLAFITGTVDQELLLRNEYLVTENRILCNQLKGRSRT